MNRKAIFLLFVVALFQGMSWSFVPTLGNTFLGSISGAQYGFLGLLLIIGAIITSFSSGAISQYVGPFRVFLAGIVLNILTQLIFSEAYSSPNIFILLSLGMFLLGAAIGSVITMINILLLHLTKHKSAAIVTLYGVVGLGATIAPFYVNFFAPKWWEASLLLTLIFVILFLFTAFNSKLKRLEIEPHQELSLQKISELWRAFPSKFIFFGLIGILFGIYESSYSVWGPIFLHQTKHLSTFQASQGITAFWGASTIGHFAFALIFYKFRSRIFYPLFPIAMLLAIVFTNFAKTPDESLGLFAFAGLSTAAFFPLTVRFASAKFPHLEGPIFGTLYAFYFLGTGFMSYFLGIIQHALNLPLGYLFLFLPIVPIVLFVLSLAVLRVPKTT